MKSLKKYLVGLLLLILTFTTLGCQKEKEDTRTKGEKIGDGIGEVFDGLFGE